jgi:hypothetical protein
MTSEGIDRSDESSRCPAWHASHFPVERHRRSRARTQDDCEAVFRGKNSINTNQERFNGDTVSDACVNSTVALAATVREQECNTRTSMHLNSM